MKVLFLFSTLLFLGSTVPTVEKQSIAIDIGGKAPEIKLPSLKGDTITLSSLKGKLVLIDFWATWCAPCVKEQKELADLYRKFKYAEFTNGKGFEIYGVSLDAKKNNWESYIVTNKINWIQVSDLKFWRSPVAKSYNIQELPYNLLVDDNGIIVARNLHGADLENRISLLLRK